MLNMKHSIIINSSRIINFLVTFLNLRQTNVLLMGKCSNKVLIYLVLSNLKMSIIVNFTQHMIILYNKKTCTSFILQKVFMSSSYNKFFIIKNIML